jgi:hypothetical protein
MKNLKNNYTHRLAMIQDELKALREFIQSSSELQSKFGEPSSYSDTALTHLNNIEVACDLEDTESLRWKPYTSKPTMKKFKVDVTRTSLASKVFIVEALTQEDAEDMALELAIDEIFDDVFDTDLNIYETTEIND